MNSLCSQHCWHASWDIREGQKEDLKRQESNQQFLHLEQLNLTQKFTAWSVGNSERKGGGLVVECWNGVKPASCIMFHLPMREYYSLPLCPREAAKHRFIRCFTYPKYLHVRVIGSSQGINALPSPTSCLSISG